MHCPCLLIKNIQNNRRFHLMGVILLKKYHTYQLLCYLFLQEVSPSALVEINSKSLSGTLLGLHRSKLTI